MSVFFNIFLTAEYFQGDIVDYRKKLGQRIRELRKKRGLRQEQLAELSNVEPTSVSNIENGRNYPSLQTLEKFINVLEISFSDVFQFEHNKQPENLLEEINRILKKHPDKISDVYKIIKALID